MRVFVIEWNECWYSGKINLLLLQGKSQTPSLSVVIQYPLEMDRWYTFRITDSEYQTAKIHFQARKIPKPSPNNLLVSHIGNERLPIKMTATTTSAAQSIVYIAANLNDNFFLRVPCNIS